MLALLTDTLLWATALGSGLMAGVYFAFSGFIMKSFDTLEATQSVAAMKAINETILRSWFMPVFFGSSIASLLLVILAIANWDRPGAGLMMVAGLVYIVGMFVCTAAFNVPLNHTLTERGPDSTDAAQVWSQYLTHWTKWNHVRTVSSLITSALCISLLVQPATGSLQGQKVTWF